MSENNKTIQWIGIIVGIIVALTGWFFAGTQSAASHRISEIEAEAKATRIIVNEVQRNQSVVMEQLLRIRQDIEGLKQDIKKYGADN